MPLVKISVENLENNERCLYELDIDRPLKESIAEVCALFNKPPEPEIYDLKLLARNDGQFVHAYISPDTLNQIKNGYFLKLVYSIDYYLESIFDHLDDEQKEKSFDDLYNLSVEPEFIKALAKSGRHTALIEHFTDRKGLVDRELTACLIAIVHLFQRGHIQTISGDFLDRIIGIIKSDDSKPEQIKYSLSIIHKILYHKNKTFKRWKEEIMKEITLSELTPYIWSEEHKDLQYGALLLMNTIIKCCNPTKRHEMINEINLQHNREYIYNYIIVNGKIDKNMAHELYVYQTHLLSLHKDDMECYVNVNDTNILDNLQPECDISLMGSLMDFNELPIKNPSLETLHETNDYRLSKYSDQTSSSGLSTNTLINLDTSNVKVTLLTLKALRFYRGYHYGHYCQSEVEEQQFEPGIFVTGERVIKILIKLLHIGKEPDKSSTNFQPVIFKCSSKTPFLFELFSGSMWLFSKTRKEMKARTLHDYAKVLKVLEKQLDIILNKRLPNFDSFTKEMLEINYHIVMKQWQKEKQEEINSVLTNNPCIKDLKDMFIKDNEKLVFKQRINCLNRGEVFLRVNDKKINGQFFARLAENNKQLIIYEWNAKKNKYEKEIGRYAVSKITHVVQEKACPHVKNHIIKDHRLAFSLLINKHEYINFTANDKKTAYYWADGFNLLLGKNNLSEYYQQELDELVRMDVMVHLIELQNVTIPKVAPVIPRNPFDQKEKPPLPPKPNIV